MVVVCAGVVPSRTVHQRAVEPAESFVAEAAVDAVRVPRQRVVGVAAVGQVGGIAVILRPQSQLRHTHTATVAIAGEQRPCIKSTSVVNGGEK